jgi:ribonuclease HI
VWNFDGIFVAAGTKKSILNFTSAGGEASAILEAIRKAISRGCSNIIFESDSKVVVDTIQANPQRISELRSIISSIEFYIFIFEASSVKFCYNVI